MEPEQKALTSERDVILAQVKEELSTAKTVKARNPSLGEVAERRGKLIELARCFEAVQTAIEEATSNLEEEFNNRLQFEEAYYRAKDLYAERLEDSEPKAGTGNRQKCDDLWDAVRIIQETQQQILLMQCQNPPPLAPPAGSQVSNSEPQSVAKALKVFAKPAEEKLQACRTAGCQQRHHTMLCLQQQQIHEPEEAGRDRPATQPRRTEVSAVSENATQSRWSSVPLPPAEIVCKEKEDGESQQVRGLVNNNSGSQVSHITEESVKRFGMKCTNASLEVSEANGDIVGTTPGADTRVMPSRFNGETKLTTQAYVLGGLTAALPSQRFSVADGQVKNLQRILVAQRFIFGWMVARKIWKPCRTRTPYMVLDVAQELDINRSLRLSWEDQEILGTKRLRANKGKFQQESNSKEQIVKEDIIGIKLRVVHDGFYATTTGVSRNNLDRQNTKLCKKLRTVGPANKYKYTKGKQILEKRLSLIEVCRQRSRVIRSLNNLRPEKRSGSSTPGMQFARLARSSGTGSESDDATRKARVPSLGAGDQKKVETLSQGGEDTGGKSGNIEHCVIPSGAASAKKMERFREIVHQRELAQGKLTTILESVASATTLTWATLKTCQKDVEAAYDAYHTAYGQILGMVSATLRDEQDALYDAFDDLHTEVLTVIEEKLQKVSQPTRRRNAYTPGVPQWVDETTNPTTAKIVGCANEAVIDEPQKRSGKLLAEQLDTEDRVRPEFTIPHGERSENNHKIEKPKTIIDTCKIADEKDSSHPTKKPPGQNATDDPGQQKMVLTAGSEPPQKCDVCGLGQHKSWKCPQFLEMAVPQRLIKVKEKQLCFNCLRTGHTSAQCVSTGACATCKKRHNTLLHAEYRKNPKQPTTQTKVEQPGAPQQAETDQVTPEASSSGQLAPDALSAIADFRDEPCSPNPCRGLLITSKFDTHLTKNTLDIHNANELAGVERMQPRSTISVIPAGVQLADRANLVALREVGLSQDTDSTTGSSVARKVAVRAQATAFEDEPELEQHTEEREVKAYKTTSSVSDQTQQRKFYLPLHAEVHSTKTMPELVRTRTASAPLTAAAACMQLMVGERLMFPGVAAPAKARQMSCIVRSHPHERSVYADPLKRVTPDGPGESSWRSRTRCRFPTIGMKQEVLKFIPRGVQSFWQPLRLSTASVRNNTTCKYGTKLSNMMIQVRNWSKPTKPPEETTQDLPDPLGQHTGAGTLANPRVGVPTETGRQKCELWIAWRMHAILRGWRMFEPDRISSKKIWSGFGSPALAAMTVVATMAAQPALLSKTTESARNGVCETASEPKQATARR
ncbi:uncharacterized protein LOC120413846 [Culex pipiens pallens]|uniref:uncharacterized protein LOC120413846 n=1 Tax=Culex pipiens pallens TaxID=42434 RepID=UPI001954DEF5|nr:uncharacterized protein LOC120413846 [Culex pipiens pallens]